MIQILCFGDSNTWGYNPENGNRFEWGVRWTSILQQRLFEKDVRIIEEGLCGRTTVFDDKLRSGRCGIEMLPCILESHAPIDMVVLMLGTNDCKTIYHADEVEIGSGIIKLIDVIKKNQPNAKILLISPIHLGSEVWKSEFDPEFNANSVEVSYKLKEEYKKISELEKIEFLAASDYAICSKADMEHMDEDNHKSLAEAIYDKIIKLSI